ncbi:MAG: hypothetical protein ACFBQW_04440 [Sphingomonadaceae bacterium]
MQRVRIGLTGLAFVFLLVLLSAVFVSPSDEEPITANAIEQARVPELAKREAMAAPAEEEEPKEPLAELGVAPGNVEAEGQADKENGAAAADPRP